VKVQQKPIEEIIPYARNPRKNEGAIAKVAASIKEFGWQQPIVVDSEMVVVAGHTRLQAANKLNLKNVPIVVADNLTPTQVKAYRLADNRVSEESDWDDELLSLELHELLEKNFQIDLLGFNEDEIEELNNNINFEAGSEIEQGKLDELEAKIVQCPDCGYSFDLKKWI